MEGQVLGLDGQALAPVGEQQQGVVGFEEFNAQLLDNVGSDPIHVEGEFHFGLQEVELDEQPLLGLDERRVLPDALGQRPQDAHDFLALVVPEHLQLVVDLLAFGGFDEGHRSGLGRAQSRAPDLALVGAGDGQNPTAIEVAFFRVGQPALLGAAADRLVEEPVHLATRGLHVDADAAELRRGVVAHPALRVEDGFNFLDNLRVFLHGAQHPAQSGEGPLAAVQRADDVVDQPGALQHAHEPGLGEGRAGDFQQLDLSFDLLEDQGGKTVSFDPDPAQFVGRVEGLHHGRSVRAGRQITGPPLGTFRLAEAGQALPDLIEPEVLGRLGIKGHAA